MKFHEPMLDIEIQSDLHPWLIQRGLVRRNEEIHIRNLEGGVSNRTVLVQRSDGTGMVLKQALETLRVQDPWHCDPARVHREAAALRILQEIAPPGTVPPFLFEDMDLHILGMGSVREPHDNLKNLLLSGHCDPELMSALGNLLANIHVLSSERMDELAIFADRSYFLHLRLEPYYETAAHRLNWAAGFLNSLIVDTKKYQQALVHGDFSPKNVLIVDSKPVLLDYEVAHLGDPAFDGGFFLTHLLAKAVHLPAAGKGLLDGYRVFADAWLKSCGNRFGDDLERRCVAHHLGCLLARCAGRSPLEYLSDTHKQTILLGVRRCLNSPPRTLGDFLNQWETDR